MNKAFLLGNCTADPELRFTQGGQAVLNIRLATNESYLDRDKQRKERTDYHQVVVWGARAEGLGKILTKGSSLMVEGRIQTSSYDDKDGNKKYKTEIVANNVILTGGRPRGGDAGDGPGAPPQRDAGQRNGGGYGGSSGGRGYGGGGSRPASRNHSPPPDDFGDYGGGNGNPDDDIPFASSSMSHDLRRCGM
ncbi:single-stranded DNA-binding protein [Sorangium sp. So ce118]